MEALQLSPTIPSQESSAIMEQNPFLDPFNIPQGGHVSEKGQPLIRLQIPPIHTLVYKTDESTGNLFMIDAGDAFQQAGVTPSRPILTEEEDIGIQLDLNVFGIDALQIPSQMNPAEIGGQTLGRNIPTNYQEARNVLHLIVMQRAGSQNAAYNITDLKRIARNLDLSPSGSKAVLANRIRTAIIDFFGMPQS